MSNEQNLHTRSCLLGREGAGRAGNCGFRDVHPERGHWDLAIYSAIKPAFCRWPCIADHIPLFISRSTPWNRMRIRNLEKNKFSNMPGSLTLKRERGATPKRDYKIPQTGKHRRFDNE